MRLRYRLGHRMRVGVALGLLVTVGVGNTSCSRSNGELAPAEEHVRTAIVEDLTDHGPARAGLVIDAATFVLSPAGPIAYAVTRNERPARILRVYLLDPHAETMCTLKGAVGARAMVVVGELLFVGTYWSGRLFVVDRRTGEILRTVDVPGAEEVKALAYGAGKLYLGTQPTGKVYEYDIELDALRDLGEIEPGTFAVRSLAVDEHGVIIAGTGTVTPKLIYLDPRTVNRKALLTSELAGESYVYSVAVNFGKIFAGTSPRGRFIILDATTHCLEAVFETGEHTITDIWPSNADRKIYFAGQPSGSLYEYCLDTMQMRVVVTPVPFEIPQGFLRCEQELFGIGAAGTLWHYKEHTGELIIQDLRSLGIEGKENVPMAFAVGPYDLIYVGGAWSLAVVNPATGERAHVWTPRETKALAATDSFLYLAIYPGAELWRFDPTSGALRQVATTPPSQDRPLVLKARGPYVAMGTEPQKGKRGGALLLYREDLETFTVHEEVVLGHSISALAFHEPGLLAIGTSARGGAGATSPLGSGHLVLWDLAGSRKVYDGVPVPEADAIAALVSLGGLIVGLASNGVLFIFDPAAAQIVCAVHHVPSVPHPSRVGLVATPTGKVCGTSGDVFFTFDPISRVYSSMAMEKAWFLAVDSSNRLYFVSDFHIMSCRLP